MNAIVDAEAVLVDNYVTSNHDNTQNNKILINPPNNVDPPQHHTKDRKSGHKHKKAKRKTNQFQFASVLPKKDENNNVHTDVEL